MAYVYRHIRLDKKQPFYIGIGVTKRRYKTRLDRNKIWERIAEKSDYESEILMDGLSWGEAIEKEKEFIKLYGRINNKTGILANMTDGGDGAIGNIQSEETRMKRSIAMTGKKKRPRAPYKNGSLSPSHREALSKSQTGTKRTMTPKRILADNRNSKPINQFSLNGEYLKSFISIREASRYLNKPYSCNGIVGVCKGKFKHAYGFIWKYYSEINQIQ